MKIILFGHDKERLKTLIPAIELVGFTDIDIHDKVSELLGALVEAKAEDTIQTTELLTAIKEKANWSHLGTLVQHGLVDVHITQEGELYLKEEETFYDNL